MVPALLPPPAPFKLFVLMAGVAEVRPLQFVLAIAAARGLRYLVLGAARDPVRRRGARVDADPRPRCGDLGRGDHRCRCVRLVAVQAIDAVLDPEISIVIPLRDEEENVAPLHDELSRRPGSDRSPVRVHPR